MNNRMNLLSVEVLITIILIVVGVYYFTESVAAVFLVFLLLSGGAYFLAAWVGLPLSFPIQFVYDAEISTSPDGNSGLLTSWNPSPVNVPEVFMFLETSIPMQIPRIFAQYMMLN